MKVKIGDYVVSVNARFSMDEKNSKRATLSFLNYISILLREASDSNRKNGYVAISSAQERNSFEIYKLLEKEGLYK